MQRPGIHIWLMSTNVMQWLWTARITIGCCEVNRNCEVHLHSTYAHDYMSHELYITIAVTQSEQWINLPAAAVITVNLQQHFQAVFLNKGLDLFICFLIFVYCTLSHYGPCQAARHRTSISADAAAVLYKGQISPWCSNNREAKFWLLHKASKKL